ncbi:MAG: NADH-quinone oxidoreductase subunit D [Limnochordaceae bacterium]|nr:NADH-quinone oxidoreductase subunit D [Limnochordaceae bacterium]
MAAVGAAIGIEAKAVERIRQRYPGVEAQVLPSGWIEARVSRDQWLEFARGVREDPELAFDFLSNLSAVDRGDAGFEVVLHLEAMGSGMQMVARTTCPRDEARVPSVTSVWPTANWHEREAWDLMGVRFDGHPDLRRILLKDNWVGHPLRKDYVDRRLPRQRQTRASYRPDDPNTTTFDVPAEGVAFAGDGVHPAGGAPVTRVLEVPDTYSPRIPPSGVEVNMGPQHPSTHGVLRLLAEIDGERIVRTVPDIGFLHRCFEKIAENLPYPSVIPYTDRTDYLSGMTNELAYVLAVEQLFGIEVPAKAQAIRVLVAELQRIASHLVWFGSMALDLGAVTPFLYAWREREKLLDIFETLSGARMMFHYVRLGGVRNELPSGLDGQIRKFLDSFDAYLAEYDEILTGNPIFQARTRDVAVLPAATAIAYGASGPVLRASGVAYDLRKTHPYSGYEQYDFSIPVGERGDVLDRYTVRMEEMRQSARIARQALEGLPEGEIMGKTPRRWKAPAGDAYSRVEAPRGELGVHVVSDGQGDRPYRVHWRAPSFVHLQLLPVLTPGLLIADVVAVIGSIDIVLGEVDR